MPVNTRCGAADLAVWSYLISLPHGGIALQSRSIALFFYAAHCLLQLTYVSNTCPQTRTGPYRVLRIANCTGELLVLFLMQPGHGLLQL